MGGSKKGRFYLFAFGWEFQCEQQGDDPKGIGLIDFSGEGYFNWWRKILGNCVHCPVVIWLGGFCEHVDAWLHVFTWNREGTEKMPFERPQGHQPSLWAVEGVHWRAEGIDVGSERTGGDFQVERIWWWTICAICSNLFSRLQSQNGTEISSSVDLLGRSTF